jgi:prophage maintenance system killer protein
MEVVMVLNGLELRADVDASEAVVLAVASGTMDRSALARWLTAHQCPCGLD